MAATMNLPIADSLSLHQTHRSQEPADLGTDAAKHFHSHSRSSDVHRQPGDPGSFEAIERRGGSEDPWLCAPDFRQVCFCRTINDPPIGDSVNSGIYIEKLDASRSASGALLPVGSLATNVCFFKRAATFRKQPLDQSALSVSLLPDAAIVKAESDAAHQAENRHERRFMDHWLISSNSFMISRVGGR